VSFRRFLVALVGSAFLVVVVVGVFPIRTYLDQRDEISSEEARVRVLGDENQKLASRVKELGTDAEVERLAREQYNLVRPGEQAFAILPGPADPEPSVVPAAPPPPPPQSLWAKAKDALTFWN
jgi:cell division protein FtsB